MYLGHLLSDMFLSQNPGLEAPTSRICFDDRWGGIFTSAWEEPVFRERLLPPHPPPQSTSGSGFSQPTPGQDAGPGEMVALGAVGKREPLCMLPTCSTGILLVRQRRTQGCGAYCSWKTRWRLWVCTVCDPFFLCPTDTLLSPELSILHRGTPVGPGYCSQYKSRGPKRPVFILQGPMISLFQNHQHPHFNLLLHVVSLSLTRFPPKCLQGG